MEKKEKREGANLDGKWKGKGREKYEPREKEFLICDRLYFRRVK